MSFKNNIQYRIIKFNVAKPGQYTIGISQKDKRCCKKNNGYDYQGVRGIIVKPNNGNNL